MRLLNSKTFELREFNPDVSDFPEYAILSHRWEELELVYQDIRESSGADLIKNQDSPSAAKIRGCCAQAVLDGYDWVWIDTVCIDKSSSAELSESINSMYRWYQGSAVCYAYLSDVRATARPSFPNMLEFGESAWFKRGWTLQELIAPYFVEFYRAGWVEIGTKHSLLQELADITSIRPEVLSMAMSPSDCCTGERMSWACGRKTTRAEDKAYSLMGIFDINMSLLYGEGLKAYRRLQEEVLKKTEDYSILAWCHPVVPHSDLSFLRTDSGVLPGDANFYRLETREGATGEITCVSALTFHPRWPDLPGPVTISRFCFWRSTTRDASRQPDINEVPTRLTARGLTATMLVAESRGAAANGVLAWTGLTFASEPVIGKEFLVCIQLVVESAGIYMRKTGNFLSLVPVLDESTLGRFRWMALVMKTDKPEPPSSRLPRHRIFGYDDISFINNTSLDLSEAIEGCWIEVRDRPSDWTRTWRGRLCTVARRWPPTETYWFGVFQTRQGTRYHGRCGWLDEVDVSPVMAAFESETSNPKFQQLVAGLSDRHAKVVGRDGELLVLIVKSRTWRLNVEIREVMP